MPKYTYIVGHQFQGLTTEMGELSKAEMDMIGVVPESEGKNIPIPELVEEKKSQTIASVEPAIENKAEENTGVPPIGGIGILPVEDPTSIEQESIEYWQKQYFEEFGKEPAVNKKNDIEWIKSKLQK